VLDFYAEHIFSVWLGIAKDAQNDRVIDKHYCRKDRYLSFLILPYPSLSFSNMSRSDFPIFFSHPDLIYLDSAATSQKPESVISTVDHYLRTTNSNIHRWAYAIADQSEELYRQSKERFADFIGAKSAREVSYHYNATMCFNHLAQSLIAGKVLQPGDSIILPIHEHHANIVPRQMIAEAHNIEIRRLPLTEDFRLDRSALPSLLDDSTKLISLSACSNVTGDMPDLGRIRTLVGSDVLIAIDASQILGKYPIDVSSVDADVLIGTAHKMLGLTGLGMLWVKSSLRKQLVSTYGGGGMVADVTTEWFVRQAGVEGREPGTPHIVGAVSLLAAIDYIEQKGIDTIAQHDQQLAAYALDKLSDRGWVTIIGRSTPDEQRAGIISFVIEGQSSSRIAQTCADRDIAIRCGGHCTFPLRHSIQQDGWCRISFHIYNTEEEIDKVTNLLSDMVSTQ
jgi:cysteine desulfurase / selenocysteine lyase